MELRQRLDSYYLIVLRNVRDFIPKAIGTFLVQKCQSQMEMKLQLTLQKNQKVLDLLGEV
jgi:vacuolar protein sorting-associated protein 1